MSKINEDFFHKVYAIVRQIPKGKVTCYGEIAKALGTPKSSRVVGYAMNHSHQFENIPAHRVVNRNGVLTGKHHFSTSDAMQMLLEEEGLRIENDQIVNFQEHFWKPNVS